MIKVKIVRPVYIRKGPGRSFESLAPVFPSGRDIEMDGIEKGETWKGIDDWYFKFNEKGEKQSYWAGGVSKTSYADKVQDFITDPFNKPFFDAANPAKAEDWKLSWGHVDLEIWKIWKQFNTTGRGVKVAIIDTGIIDTGNDLAGKVNTAQSHNFLLLNNTGIRDTDPDIHGTKCAGVVAADGKTVQSVLGVAPGCEVVVYRLFNNSDDREGYTDQNFCQALSRARQSGVDIISMSFESADVPDGVENEIQACVKQNILLVAAAGNIRQGEKTVNRYPASLNGCLSVGAYCLSANNQRVINTAFSCKSDHLFCLAPGKDIRTTGSAAGPELFHATSAATAFMAGILALAVSYRKSKRLPVPVPEFKEKIQQACERIDVSREWDPSEGFGVINPLTLITSL